MTFPRQLTWRWDSAALFSGLFIAQQETQPVFSASAMIVQFRDEAANQKPAEAALGQIWGWPQRLQIALRQKKAGHRGPSVDDGAAQAGFASA